MAGFVSRTQIASQLSDVPAPLSQAIVTAAGRYDVPADLLAGIWREESGSTYPNPAVNSEGYGGLFGTQDPYASTQEQADTAASILAAGLDKSGGNVPEALSYYNSGKLVGGYTSVPGVPASQTSAPPPPVLGPPDPLAGGGSHGTQQGGGGSLWGGLFGSVESAAGDVLGTAEGAAQGLWGDALGGVEESITAPLQFLKAMAWLIHPLTWLRVVEGTIGVGLIVGGVLVATGAAEKIAGDLGPAAALAEV